MRAVIYCRVSTKEQTQNLSLETQESACRVYCEKQGLKIDRVFVEEGESAKTADRTELIKMLEYCRLKKGQIQHVVVYRIDRFSRQRYDHVVLVTQLAKNGVTLKSATEPISNDAAGKLMENILSDFAQYDNDVRSERTKAGMRAALEAGRWTFGSPLGYRRKVNANGQRTLEPNPVSGPLVRKAFELYATGLYAKTDVLRRVAALGLRTQRGKALTIQTFQEMLRKPIYAGFMCVPSWEIDHVRGAFEPLVDEDVFNRVQAVLDGRSLTITPHQRNHPDFPLRRFVRCDECGTPITGSRSKGRRQHYPYYRCRNSKCLSVKMTKEQFERYFVDYLGGLRPKLEYLRLFREIVLDVWKSKQEAANPRPPHSQNVLMNSNKNASACSKLMSIEKRSMRKSIGMKMIGSAKRLHLQRSNSTRRRSKSLILTAY